MKSCDVVVRVSFFFWVTVDVVIVREEDHVCTFAVFGCAQSNIHSMQLETLDKCNQHVGLFTF